MRRATVYRLSNMSNKNFWRQIQREVEGLQGQINKDLDSSVRGLSVFSTEAKFHLIMVESSHVRGLLSYNAHLARTEFVLLHGQDAGAFSEPEDNISFGPGSISIIDFGFSFRPIDGILHRIVPFPSGIPTGS